jgi:hypothetical protein
MDLPLHYVLICNNPEILAGGYFFLCMSESV